MSKAKNKNLHIFYSNFTCSCCGGFRLLTRAVPRRRNPLPLMTHPDQRWGCRSQRSGASRSICESAETRTQCADHLLSQFIFFRFHRIQLAFIPMTATLDQPDKSLIKHWEESGKCDIAIVIQPASFIIVLARGSTKPYWRLILGGCKAISTVNEDNRNFTPFS